MQKHQNELVPARPFRIFIKLFEEWSSPMTRGWTIIWTPWRFLTPKWEWIFLNIICSLEFHGEWCFDLLFDKFNLGNIMCWTINVGSTSLLCSKTINIHFFKLLDHCVGGSTLRQLFWGIYRDDEYLSETIINTYVEHMFPFATEQFHIALRKNFQTDHHQTMVFHALSNINWTQKCGNILRYPTVHGKVH